MSYSLNAYEQFLVETALPGAPEPYSPNEGPLADLESSVSDLRFLISTLKANAMAYSNNLWLEEPNPPINTLEWVAWVEESQLRITEGMQTFIGDYAAVSGSAISILTRSSIILSGVVGALFAISSILDSYSSRNESIPPELATEISNYSTEWGFVVSRTAENLSTAKRELEAGTSEIKKHVLSMDLINTRIKGAYLDHIENLYQQIDDLIVIIKDISAERAAAIREIGRLKDKLNAWNISWPDFPDFDLGEIEKYIKYGLYGLGGLVVLKFLAFFK